MIELSIAIYILNKYNIELIVLIGSLLSCLYRWIELLRYMRGYISPNEIIEIIISNFVKYHHVRLEYVVDKRNKHSCAYITRL